MIFQKRDEKITIKTTNNNQFPFHLHKELEIFYILDGELEMTIGKQSGILKKGMLACVFPYLSHETKTPVFSKAIMLIVSVDSISDYYPEILYNISSSPFLSFSELSQEIGEIMNRILSIKEKKQDTRLIKGYLYILLGKLLPALGLKEKETKVPTIYEMIDEYMNLHFTENLTLSQLSNALGYNKYYISHVLHENFSCSFTDLLNRLRAEHAMGLLTHTEMSITDICYESGFNSIRSFYRVFKKIYNTTPKLFRTTHS